MPPYSPGVPPLGWICWSISVEATSSYIVFGMVQPHNISMCWESGPRPLGLAMDDGLLQLARAMRSSCGPSSKDPAPSQNKEPEHICDGRQTNNNHQQNDPWPKIGGGSITDITVQSKQNQRKCNERKEMLQEYRTPQRCSQRCDSPMLALCLCSGRVL